MTFPQLLWMLLWVGAGAVVAQVLGYGFPGTFICALLGVPVAVGSFLAFSYWRHR